MREALIQILPSALEQNCCFKHLRRIKKALSNERAFLLSFKAYFLGSDLLYISYIIIAAAEDAFKLLTPPC